MRCDIQDWITALSLAKQFDPKQEPLICKRLAFLIESQGNYHEA
jgi:WD repeat-containing protein 19